MLMSFMVKRSQRQGGSVNEPSVIFYLAIFTLAAAVGFGLWQAHRARKAKEAREKSAFSDRRIPPESAS